MQDEPQCLKSQVVVAKGIFHELDVAVVNRPRHGHVFRVDGMFMPVLAAYQIVQVGDFMEAFRHFLEHVDDADQFRRQEILKAEFVFIGNACRKGFVVGYFYATPETIAQNGVHLASVRAEIRGVIHQRVVQTFREESAAHSVQIDKERIGVIKRVFGNRDFLALAQVGYRDVVFKCFG